MTNHCFKSNLHLNRTFRLKLRWHVIRNSCSNSYYGALLSICRTSYKRLFHCEYCIGWTAANGKVNQDLTAWFRSASKLIFVRFSHMHQTCFSIRTFLSAIKDYPTTVRSISPRETYIFAESDAFYPTAIKLTVLEYWYLNCFLLISLSPENPQILLTSQVHRNVYCHCEKVRMIRQPTSRHLIAVN